MKSLVNWVFIVLLYDSIGELVWAYPAGVKKICELLKQLEIHCSLKKFKIDDIDH